MRKILMIFTVSLSGINLYANSGQSTEFLHQDFDKSSTLEIIKEEGCEKTICKVDCMISWVDHEGNVHTFEASAGSIFTSCEKAKEKCEAKIESVLTWD